MKLSIRMKKIIRLLAAGLSITIALCSGCFLCYVGNYFRFQDLKCKDYLETSHFANELRYMILQLDLDAEQVNTQTKDVRLPSLKIFQLHLVNNSYWEVNPNYSVSWKEMLEVPEYWYLSDDYGISEIHTEENGAVVYNNSWYEAALSEEKIKNTSEFWSISHDEYVDLIIQNAHRREGDTVQKNLSILVNEEDATESMEEATTEEDMLYDVSKFSEDCYIGRTEDFMYVYSPREDMFYTSLYGWYSVPETLFFSKSDFSIQDLTSPLDLLRHQFTSQSEILRMAFGDEYLELMREQLNLNFTKRNMVYYVVSDNETYTNAINLERLMNCNAYLCIQPTASGEYTIETFNFNNEHLTDEYATILMQSLQCLKPYETFYVGFYTTYPYDDIFSQGNTLFHQYYPFFVPALILTICMSVCFVLAEIQIFRSKESSKKQSDIRLLFIDKVPVEAMILITLFSAFFEIQTVVNALRFSFYIFDRSVVLNQIFNLVIAFAFLHLGLLSLIRRGKAGAIWKYSFFRSAFRFCKRLVTFISGQRNLTARTVELFILYCLLQLVALILVIYGAVKGDILFILGLFLIWALNIGALVILIWQVRGEQAIREGLQAFAEGNLEYQFPKRRYLSTEREIISNMGNLSDGLHKAVEKSIYDERMKAELITNVSHDIKTPLTSIINYVDLIKQEKIENEKVIHYIEVLDRKSWRLKQLMEDLVEVSKITSGNIELERMPIDFGELLRQSIGEFEDKFAEQELKIIDNIQDKSYMVFADGRRTFRILENLFQNIYKYAMPKTRVYIDLQNENDIVSLSIKNISKAPLNIDAKELMERFVRGEQSRTTEGSGLGLSIAQDLVELQDGEFRIYLDGDLFKVIITFPEFISKEVIDTDAVMLEPEKKEEIPVLEKNERK